MIGTMRVFFFVVIVVLIRLRVGRYVEYRFVVSTTHIHTMLNTMVIIIIVQMKIYNRYNDANVTFACVVSKRFFFVFILSFGKQTTPCSWCWRCCRFMICSFLMK